MRGKGRTERGVEICSPDELDSLITQFGPKLSESINPKSFLSADAYRPLPSLVRAARELFLSKRPPQLWHSVANTDGAVHAAQNIASAAYATGTRTIGSTDRCALARGKLLSDFAWPTCLVLTIWHRENRGVPAVFLSGNGPLVDVRSMYSARPGGNGKTFVRPIREYVKRYAGKSSLIPSEHIIILTKRSGPTTGNAVADVHKIDISDARSEPEHFIEFAERIPKWSVVIGSGRKWQEIHVGEEGGLGLWAEALRESDRRDEWIVHGPPEMQRFFEGVPFQASEDLSLDEDDQIAFRIPTA